MNSKIELPCKLDHNGECLICDCWLSNCAWIRLQQKDFNLETEKELLLLLHKFIGKTSNE